MRAYILLLTLTVASNFSCRKSDDGSNAENNQSSEATAEEPMAEEVKEQSKQLTDEDSDNDQVTSGSLLDELANADPQKIVEQVLAAVVSRAELELMADMAEQIIAKSDGEHNVLQKLIWTIQEALATLDERDVSTEPSNSSVGLSLAGNSVYTCYFEYLFLLNNSHLYEDAAKYCDQTLQYPAPGLRLLGNCTRLYGNDLPKDKFGRNIAKTVPMTLPSWFVTIRKQANFAIDNNFKGVIFFNGTADMCQDAVL